MATLVIGIGNPERGDDAAGIEVVRRLRVRAPRHVVLRECAGLADCLLEHWRGRPSVILVDAAASGGRPGTIRRFEAQRAPLPASLRHASTHSWGVAEAIELARNLGELPPRVVVYAIEGGAFGLGLALSHAVRRAIERVEKRVLGELAQAEARQRRAEGAEPGFRDGG